MSDAQIWYGFCTFWTDDWGKLSTVRVQGRIAPSNWDRAVRAAGGEPGIPCCPECGSVGYQMDADEWWEGVQRVEQDTPGYYSFIKALKGHCHGKGISLGDLWEEHRKKEEAK